MGSELVKELRRETKRFWTRNDKIQQAKQTEVVNNLDGSLYAILFNASTWRGDLMDLGLAYNSLIEANTLDEDILLLGNFSNADYPATTNCLDSAINRVRQVAKPNDRLLIYITTHGSFTNGKCSFKTNDGRIGEEDYEKMIQDLPVNFTLSYFAQCYSGGFAERVGYGKNIGMSSAARNETSFGRKSEIGAYFSPPLFRTFLKTNTTIEKAFDSAVLSDTLLFWGGLFNRKIPQLRWQNADPSKLYLGTRNLKK